MRQFIKRTGEDTETLVEIHPADFPNLTKDSAVNCNTIYQITLQDLMEKVENGGKIFSHKLPKIVIENLIRDVLKSNQVPTEIKEMLI